MNELNDFIDKHGGFWSGEHPEYTKEDWRHLVTNNDTLLGYWEWAYNNNEITGVG